MAAFKNPAHVQVYDRDKREAILHQRAKVIWFTGLCGSGKTTLAQNLEKVLFEKGHFCLVLDGDQFRKGMSSDLGYSEEDRKENIRRVAEMAKMIVNSGIITICSFISPTNAIRSMARKIIGFNDYIEVYLDTPIEVCEERESKGLYKLARTGIIKDFTGISSTFDVPPDPDISIDTSKVGIKEAVNTIFEAIIAKITYQEM